MDFINLYMFQIKFTVLILELKWGGSGYLQCVWLGDNVGGSYLGHVQRIDRGSSVCILNLPYRQI
jgi:hypothetical protein